MDLEERAKEAEKVLKQLEDQGFTNLIYTGNWENASNYIFIHKNEVRIVGNPNGFERAYLCSDKKSQNGEPPQPQMITTRELEEAKKLLYSDVSSR